MRYLQGGYEMIVGGGKTEEIIKTQAIPALLNFARRYHAATPISLPVEIRQLIQYARSQHL